MLECPNCRRRYCDGTRFCGHCGASLAGTTPVVVSPDHGVKEPLASGQRASGFQVKESPEETLVRPKTDGFSWQAQRTLLADEKQGAGPAANVDEVTLFIERPALRASDSSTPAFPPPPLTPVHQTVYVSPVVSAPDAPLEMGLSALAGASSVEGLPETVAAPNVISRPLDVTYASENLFTEVIGRGSVAGLSDEVELTGETVEASEVLDAAALDLPALPSTPAPDDATEGEEQAAPVRAHWTEAARISGELLADAAQEEEVRLNLEAYFAPFYKPDEVPEDLQRPADPYWHLKQELVRQRIEITLAMDELLPLVYDNHRAENQQLFVTILANHPPLEDEAWGHAAFVLGAYGNYMYRHPLSFVKKLEIWRAQLWAVYFERSYRRKYLAQRCQQLIHYFQGCAESPVFLAIALHDLETLYLYLEPGSLRKLEQTLEALPAPPADLLQRLASQMVVAEQDKAERMEKQQALIHVKKPPMLPMPAQPDKPLVKLVPSVGKKGALPQSSIRSGVNGNGNQRLAVPGGPMRESRGPQKGNAQEEEAQRVEARKWLSFLSEEQRRQFFASLRTDRLEMINQLVLQGRNQILTALRAELLKGGSLDYQRPRKSVQMLLDSRNNPQYDQFVYAFRLLNSQRLKDQQIALRLFEQNLRENIKQENEQLAREWMLYARSRAQGSTLTAPDWARAVKKGEASYEEIWNLAYYHYMTNDLVQTVLVLAPGLTRREAPISHLRLALLSSLTLLLENGPADPLILQNARDFLLRHLELWPHPLSCLAWLALSYETPGAARPLEQSRRLSTFQELLDCPIELPDARNELTEGQIKALEEALVEKTHCEEAWALWLNDYATRRPHNFAAWQRLAELSERQGRLEHGEAALQHIAGIYYDLDYMYAQEGEEEERAAELRAYVEQLFEFYRRHQWQSRAWDSFESCYLTLNHLGFWDERQPGNQKLLALVRPFLVEYHLRESRRREAQLLADSQDARARSEIRRNEFSQKTTRPLEHFKSGQRVGIFVDYENISRFLPRAEDMESVGQMLVGYAAQFGEVVSRWASASPRNLSNLTAVRTGLEAAQFKIRFPRRELQFSASQKDLADYALLECINTASLNDRLNVYLVVSGDRDYYERIYSLLENGHTVRILACEDNLSNSYRELEQQRQRKHKAAGREETDFFIDELEDVLHSDDQ